MDLDRFFYQHPLFTYQEWLAHIAVTRPVHQGTAKSLLQYYLKKHRLIRVRRGLYAAIPPGEQPASYPLDGYSIAAKLTDDAVLAYHTALELHGVAYSDFSELTYLSAKRIPPFSYQQHRFKAIVVNTALLQLEGIVELQRQGTTLRVTSLERTLVDVLNHPEWAGGWEEVWRSLEAIASFDTAQVVDYTLRLNNATLAAKVGFYLEQLPEVLKVDEAYLQQLEDHRPHSPHYLERTKRSHGKLIKRWNLIIPEALLNQRWEEPHDFI